MANDLSSTIGPGRDDVLPGFTIAPLDLGQIAEIEQELKIRHLVTASEAAERLSEKAGKAVQERADAAVASGLFSYGSPVFEREIFAATFFPFLLWVNIKASKPIAKTEAAKIYADAPNKAAVRVAVFGAMGYTFNSPKDGDEKKADAPPTGGASSTSSEPSADSAGTTSSA